MILCNYCEEYESANKQAVSQHKNYCHKNPINITKYGEQANSRWYCKLCDISFSARRIQREHNVLKKHSRSDFIVKVGREDFVCIFCKKTKTTNKTGISQHQKYCHANPNRTVKPKVSKTAEEKEHLSKIMKARHAAGIASRWQNPHLYTSYAEKFFASVIENEFVDKKYTKELRLGKYFLDFAWEDKKKAIEIDGQQHERYAHQRKSDQQKDKFASENGWHILRINFKDMYHNPKKYIGIAKDFIENE